jgi:GDP-L-galactose phosphorylase
VFGLVKMMLKIKRVPTVVSNYQKEEAGDAPRTVGGCGRNCLKACCIQGTICFFD